MDIDLSQYMGMYVEGSRENLDMMDKMLLELEQDPTNFEAVAEIFRASHTLKGMSATMGFDKIAHLTHEMETVLDKLRNKIVPVTQEVIDVLFETFDVLRILVNDSISATESSVDLTTLVQKLTASITEKASAKKPELQQIQIVASPQQTETPSGKAATTGFDLSGLEMNEFEFQVLLEAQQREINIVLIQVTLVADCLLKAPRAFMVARTLEELSCEILKSIPETKDLEEEKFDLSFKMLLISPATPEEVKYSIEGISEIERVDAKLVKAEDFKTTQSAPTITPDAPPPPPAPPPVPKAPPSPAPNAAPSAASSRAAVPTAQPTQQQPVTQAAPAKPQPAPVHAAPAATPPAKPPAKPPSKTSTKPAASKAADSRSSQTVRVDMRRLDDLMNLVGELVINKTRLADIGAVHKLKDLNETLARVSQISTSLQNVVMQVRMVPIEQVFDRFPRMVRDLSKKLNKKIDLVLEGKETEMDRTVIDEIGDPMVHLIRNSIDHGIELPADRTAKGKPETGTITLVAKHEGNNVIIEIRDDGKGVDPSIISRLAVQRGLFTAEQMEKMPPEEIIKIIFMAGFSTAEVVSDLSGRGVGMDAVKSKLEELNGVLEIESKVNEGTRIIIKLPLTLAILQALMVQIGDEIFAIPLGNVQETMDLRTDQINIVQHQEVTLLRGDVLPIIRLHKILEVPAGSAKHREEDGNGEEDKIDEFSVVVCSSGEKRAGFMVDELLGQQEIVIKSLGNLLGGLPGIMGATMRGDGSIALILDIPAFFQSKGQTIS